MHGVPPASNVSDKSEDPPVAKSAPDGAPEKADAEVSFSAAEADRLGKSANTEIGAPWKAP